MAGEFEFQAEDDGTIVWSIDKYNNITTMPASEAKARFASLSVKQLTTLKQSLVALGVKPTLAAQKSYWGTIIDAAAQNYASASETGKPYKDIWQESSSFVNKQLKSGTFGGVSNASMNYVELTAPEQARVDLRNGMMDMLGRIPTDEEYKEYVKNLNKQERKFASRVVQTPGAQTAYRNNFDSAAYLTKYIVSKTDFKEDLNKAFGVAQDTVNELLNMNGVAGNITPAKKNKLIKQFITKEIDVDGLKAAVNDIAKNAYGAFADLMEGNKTLYEAANDYIGTYANMLEVNPNTADVKDALSKATVNNNGQYVRLSLSDYEKSLRQDSRYQYTKRATDEAQNLAYSFAKAFGVNI